MEQGGNKFTLTFAKEEEDSLPLHIQVKYINGEPFTAKWIKSKGSVPSEEPAHPKDGYKEMSGRDQLYLAHALAVRHDGSVIAWGRNDFGQCDIPSNLNGVVQVRAGFSHSVALLNDGTIRCWGQNEFKQCDISASESDRFISIHASHLWSAAMRLDGTVHLWGAFNSDWFLPMSWEEKISNKGWIDLIKNYHSIVDTRCIPLRMYENEEFKTIWTLLELSGNVKRENPLNLQAKSSW